MVGVADFLHGQIVAVPRLELEVVEAVPAYTDDLAEGVTDIRCIVIVPEVIHTDFA
jgi:hypothetical protein